MSTISTPSPRPNMNDLVGWRAYWGARGQSWRTEPEIDSDRQKYLKERLETIVPTFRLYKTPPFKNVDLSRADVEWILATYGDKKRSVDLGASDLRRVNLSGLPLEGVNLSGTHLEKADLSDAHLQGVDLSKARLEGANLSGAYLQKADLSEAHLEGANLIEVQWEGANLFRTHLKGVDLSEADLRGVRLAEAHLEGANLSGACLEKVDLVWTHLEETDLSGANLEGADLCGAFFSSATDLRGIVLSNKQVGFASLAGVRWGEVDLSVVDWTQVNVLGDEYRARQRQTNDGNMKDTKTRLNDYQTAVRANRQLSVVLRDQGLNEEADHFAYLAHVLQRVVWRRQRRFLKYVGSWVLWLLAGYGYRPRHSIISYLVIIFGFMGLYLLNAHFVAPHLS